MKIPLASRKYPGLVAEIDEEDEAIVGNYVWYPLKSGNTFYAVAHVPPTSKVARMHRLILPEVPGCIDHADRNGLNNTRSNLRPATKSLNAANQRKRSDNKSGFIGVIQDKRCGRWHAYLRADGTTISLGYYDTPEEAALARDAQALRSFGDFANLNFPVPHVQVRREDGM